MTRPDISNAVRNVARHAHDPTPQHWEAVRYMLRCLHDTKTLGLTFEKGRGLDPVVYSDSNYARDENDRRSVSGGAILCGGATVSWFSRTQRCVTLSSTEAEYVAMGEVVKEALFVRNVLEFLVPGVHKPPIVVYEDNEGAIKLADNPLSTARTRHIDVRHHFLREKVDKKEISVLHVESER